MAEAHLFGKYRLGEELGRGGFGTIYRAEDTSLHVERAVKILHPAFNADPIFIERFRQEARIAARLDHPNIVPVYDLGQHEGSLYLVMRLMNGGSLKDLLASEGKLPVEKALTYLDEIAAGLDFAHSFPERLVHRDIKPGNILLEENGAARISDFGFSKALEGASSVSLSATGGMVGTPPYMAPELWRGQATGPATDIYSFACMFFEMITGDILFKGNTPPQIMTLHVLDGPSFPDHWLDDLPPDLQTVLERALAMKPEDRFGTAGAFARAIRRCFDTPVQPPILESPPPEAIAQPPPEETVHPEETAPPQVEIEVRSEETAPPPVEAEAAPVKTAPPPEAETPAQTKEPLPSKPAAGPPVQEPATSPPDTPVKPPAGSDRDLWKLPPKPAPKKRRWSLYIIIGIGIFAVCGLFTPLMGDPLNLFVTPTPTPTRTPTASPTFTLTPTRTKTPTPNRAATQTEAAQRTLDANARLTRTAAARLTEAAGTAQAAQTATREADPHIFGPVDGVLVHNPDDGFVELDYGPEELRDFAATATFFTPYDLSKANWSIGFLFRSVSGESFRLVIRGSDYWMLTYYDGESSTTIQSGDLQNLSISQGSANSIELIAYGSSGIFFLNGEFISALDLRAISQAGDLGAATGLISGDEVEGFATEYTDFNIWRLEPAFGPASGALDHKEDNLLETYWSSVEARDALMEVQVTAPYSPDFSNWTAGFLARHVTADQQLRVYVNAAASGSTWVIGDRMDENFTTLSSGEIPAECNFDPDGVNQLLFITRGDTGVLFINGIYAGSADISIRRNTGNVIFSIGFINGSERDGYATGYDSFTVIELP